MVFTRIAGSAKNKQGKDGWKWHKTFDSTLQNVRQTCSGTTAIESYHYELLGWAVVSEPGDTMHLLGWAVVSEPVEPTLAKDWQKSVSTIISVMYSS